MDEKVCPLHQFLTGSVFLSSFMFKPNKWCKWENSPNQMNIELTVGEKLVCALFYSIILLLCLTLLFSVFWKGFLRAVCVCARVIFNANIPWSTGKRLGFKWSFFLSDAQMTKRTKNNNRRTGLTKKPLNSISQRPLLQWACVSFFIREIVS